MSPRRLQTAVLLGILAVGLAGPGLTRYAGGEERRPRTGTVRREVDSMGTRATLTTLDDDRARGLATLERMLRVLEAVEGQLSTWRLDSHLSAINRQPVGAEAPAPEPVCDLLEELLSWHQATGGAFDPAVGTLVAAWGLRQGGRQPAPAELEEARRNVGLSHVLVRRGPCRITRIRGVVLDAGAFGKGAALDRVAEGELVHGTRAWMVDLGGQVAAGGTNLEAWRVSLAHPARRREAVLDLSLRVGSLATSGGSERDLVSEGRTLGHILDPRIGQPVSRGETVTVWHERALVADVLSTALYVMGVEAGLAWAEEQGITACFLLSDPTGGVRTRATRAFRRRFFEASGP